MDDRRDVGRDAPTLDDGKLMYAFGHDLRSHLRTVLTRIRLVQIKAAGALSEQESTFLEEAASAGEEMNALLSAMVNYCGVTASREATTLDLVFRGMMLDLKRVLDEASAQIFIVNEIEAPVLNSLMTVMRELVTNACRFRSKGSPVEIRVATDLTDPEMLRIAVSDNGQGVPPEFRERIFQPFVRLLPRSEYPGFGLGLAHCRRIVDIHGGTIHAEESDTGGLKVVVTLPVLSV